MKENNILRWIVVLVFILVVVITFLIVAYFKNQKKYEYYTFDNIKGISYKCENKKVNKCRIKGKMVEVSQYSEIKKEEK